MRQNHTGELSNKTDGSLNELILKIKRAITPSGLDAFVAYRQGMASKHELCEAIAKEMV